jgi:hypothetical protein
MSDKTVPLDAFLTVVKILYSQLNELTVGVMSLRAALMQAQSLPVPAEELKRLHDFFHEYEPIRKARERIESLTLDTNEELIEFLKNFEGPLQ